MKGLLCEVRAVVFDMDGLIFDTEPLYRDAFVAVAAEQGHEMSAAFYHSTIGFSARDARPFFRKHYGPAFDFDLFWNLAIDRFYQMARTGLGLKPGIAELLDDLDALGLPRAIATGSSHADVLSHLGLHGLTERFPIIVAQEDYEKGKPNPDPFLKAAERMGVDPQFCLALEDSHNGVRAARSAGMLTIMVPDLLPATTEMENLCAHVARDLHEVRALIAR